VFFQSRFSRFRLRRYYALDLGKDCTLMVNCALRASAVSKQTIEIITGRPNLKCVGLRGRPVVLWYVLLIISGDLASLLD
jgi:hypothetical protein